MLQKPVFHLRKKNRVLPFRKNNFYFLLAALLILMLVQPVLMDIYGKRNLLFGHLTFSITLLLSIVSISQVRKWRTTGISLVILGVIFSSISYSFDNQLMMYLSLLVDLLFLFLVTSLALEQVIFSESITLHNVVGALCVYILLGIMWAVAYYFVSLIMPGSFSGNLSADLSMQIHDFVYFSFITLTTLGYGDIVPQAAIARTLVYMEAILGQFYIATLVAGLVAIHISSKIGEDK